MKANTWVIQYKRPWISQYIQSDTPAQVFLMERLIITWRGWLDAAAGQRGVFDWHLSDSLRLVWSHPLGRDVLTHSFVLYEITSASLRHSFYLRGGLISHGNWNHLCGRPARLNKLISDFVVTMRPRSSLIVIRKVFFTSWRAAVWAHTSEKVSGQSARQRWLLLLQICLTSGFASGVA